MVWNVIRQAVLVLFHGAVLALELDDLIDEDLLIGKTKQELAVELQLRGNIQCALNKLHRVFE